MQVGLEDHSGEKAGAGKGADLGLFDLVVAAFCLGTWLLTYPLQAKLPALEGLSGKREQVNDGAIRVVEPEKPASRIKESPEPMHHDFLMGAADLVLPQAVRGAQLQAHRVDFRHSPYHLAECRLEWYHHSE